MGHNCEIIIECDPDLIRKSTPWTHFLLQNCHPNTSGSPAICSHVGSTVQNVGQIYGHNLIGH